MPWPGLPQRQHRVLLLGPQAQHRAAGGQDRQAGAAGQQLTQVAGGPDHLLQVVQDQQPGTVADLLGQGLQRRARPRQVGAYRPADAGEHQPGIGDRRQRDERGSHAEAVTQPLAHRHRQPVLPTPPGPVRVTNRTPGRSTRLATSPMACSPPTSEGVPTGSGGDHVISPELPRAGLAPGRPPGGRR